MFLINPHSSVFLLLYNHHFFCGYLARVQTNLRLYDRETLSANVQHRDNDETETSCAFEQIIMICWWFVKWHSVEGECNHPPSHSINIYVFYCLPESLVSMLSENNVEMLSITVVCCWWVETSTMQSLTVKAIKSDNRKRKKKNVLDFQKEILGEKKKACINICFSSIQRISNYDLLATCCPLRNFNGKQMSL